MKNNILNLAVVLTVGVILTGSLLMPVITDIQHTTSDKATALNRDNAPYIAETSEFEYYASTETETVNGESISVSTYTQIITTDAGVLYKLGTNTYTLFIPSENVKALINLGTSTPNITAAIENDTFSVSYGSTEYSVTITESYAYVGAGEYSESSVWPTFKTNAGISGLITVGDGYYSPINGIAIIPDWLTGSGTFYYYSGGWVESSAPVTWDVADNGDGSYTISNIVIDSTETIPTTHRVLFQNEYWTYTPTAASNLLGVIPVMVIVMLLMIAVGGLYLRRSD